MSREQRKEISLAIFDTVTFGLPMLLWNLFKDAGVTLYLMSTLFLIVVLITISILFLT
ncbi:hypothetical protein [Bacillus sp. NPDC077027]|uniref:hypothetical protein n=1 Tax=Bacillus sp. NPDC077027 TaxID=3390548 RepID=UPI003CFC0E03